MSSHSLGPTGFAETHVARVFFVDDRAYKVKKPVSLGFLDFSTREAREQACQREVELNRRLAPDVYLGVADIAGPDGEVCEHMVVMRRMPEERRLSMRLADGADMGDCLREVARKLAALHARSATSRTHAEIGEVARRDGIKANWTDNFETIRHAVGEVIEGEEFDRVQRLATRFLAGREPLFDERIAEGMARDGHGDLLAEDIFCLDDGPRILDCLEFADRYRYGDVLLDAAFLAMDLERLGHPDAARRFLAWYEEFSGEHHPATLIHHYIAYRAHVRTKVACLRHAQDRAADSAEQARGLHRLALDHLRRGRVVMLLVGGLPGTGKSTLAQGLSDTFEWALLSSDEIRKDLFGIGHHTDAHADPDEGLYEPEQVARVYGELLQRARRLLELGVPVVLDASWISTGQRKAAADVAAQTHSDLVSVRCETSLEMARARLATRPPGTGVSDAHPDVLEAMASQAEQWPEAATVRTDRAIDAVLHEGRTAVREQLLATERA